MVESRQTAAAQLGAFNMRPLHRPAAVAECRMQGAAGGPGAGGAVGAGSARLISRSAPGSPASCRAPGSRSRPSPCIGGRSRAAASAEPTQRSHRRKPAARRKKGARCRAALPSPGAPEQHGGGAVCDGAALPVVPRADRLLKHRAGGLPVAGLVGGIACRAAEGARGAAFWRVSGLASTASARAGPVAAEKRPAGAGHPGEPPSCQLVPPPLPSHALPPSRTLVEPGQEGLVHRPRHHDVRVLLSGAMEVAGGEGAQ